VGVLVGKWVVEGVRQPSMFTSNDLSSFFNHCNDNWMSTSLCH